MESRDASVHLDARPLSPSQLATSCSLSSWVAISGSASQSTLARGGSRSNQRTRRRPLPHSPFPSNFCLRRKVSERG